VRRWQHQRRRLLLLSSAVIEGQNEAGKIEITEETQIMSLEEEEKARAKRSKAEEVEGYLSDEELVGAEVPASTATSTDRTDESTTKEEADSASTQPFVESISPEGAESAERGGLLIE
jgi:hypothetical protein